MSLYEKAVEFVLTGASLVSVHVPLMSASAPAIGKVTVSLHGVAKMFV